MVGKKKGENLATLEDFNKIAASLHTTVSNFITETKLSTGPENPSEDYIKTANQFSEASKSPPQIIPLVLMVANSQAGLIFLSYCTKVSEVGTRLYNQDTSSYESAEKELRETYLSLMAAFREDLRLPRIWASEPVSMPPALPRKRRGVRGQFC